MQVTFEDTFEAIIRLKQIYKNPIALDFAGDLNKLVHKKKVYVGEVI